MRNFSILAATAATLLALALATPAQAVTWDYCAYSLRGGGTLAPDHDVRRVWDQLEASRGQLSHTAHAYWLEGQSGAYSVVEGVYFYFQRGGAEIEHFRCEGSGSSYIDYWLGY
jgi:hypothetical protein